MEIRREGIILVEIKIGDILVFEDSDSLWMVCEDGDGFILRCFYDKGSYGHSGYSETLEECLTKASKTSGRIIKHYPSSNYYLKITRK